jgi:hypothetical protein
MRQRNSGSVLCIDEHACANKKLLVHPGHAYVARTEEAKVRLRYAIDLDREIRKLAIDDEDLKALLGLE